MTRNRPEESKLQRLFASDSDLRDLIPSLIKNKLYFERLEAQKNNWKLFWDVLQEKEVEIGDALEIFRLLNPLNTIF